MVDRRRNRLLFLIAATWGSNLAVVYPFVEIVFEGHTLSSWADGETARLEAELVTVDQELASGATEISASERQARLAKRIDMLQRAEPWIDAHAPQTPFGTLVALIVFILLMTVTRSLLLGANMMLVTRVSHGVVFRLQNLLFRSILRSDLYDLERHGTGSLAGRIHYETLHVGTTIQTLVGRMMREPLKLLTCLIGAGMVNWRLLVLSLLICPAVLFVLMKITRAIKETSQRALEDAAGLMNQLIESLTYIKAIRAHNMEASMRRDVRATTAKIYQQQLRIAGFDALLRGNNEVLGTGVLCLSFFAGGYLVLGGHTHILGIRMAAEPMTFSSLALFYGLLLGTTDPLRKLGGVHMTVRLGAVAADRLFGHLDQPRTILGPANPQPIPSEPRPIRFEQVTFGYRPNQPVLKEIDLEVAAGQKVAILGANGSGKSTLMDLLPRFYDPQQGRIRIDDQPITEFAVRDLRRYFTIVSQRTALFDDTVARNIAYGCGAVELDQIRDAAAQARALDFIERLPEGLETRIGEHGGRLSGGERQRISLARAILRNSPVVILDEATSQIDQESERLIHESLSSFLADRTGLIVTHRTRTLELVDRIIVLDSGQIVADSDRDPDVREKHLQNLMPPDQPSHSAQRQVA